MEKLKLNNLQRLKEDRDICYNLACAAYGQEFVNELLHEGDEINETGTARIEETRRTLVPLPRQLASTELLRDTARTFHEHASIRDNVSPRGRANEHPDDWYLQ